MDATPLPFHESRIAIGVPIATEVLHWRFMASVMQMEKPPQHGLIVRQGSIVDKSRNEIVKMMLDHPAKFTHLCFLDSDMIFPVSTLRALIERQVPVIAGLCYQRVPPFKPVVFERQAQADGAKTTYVFTDLQPPEGGLQQVASAGSGCLLIAREVLEKMAFPWFLLEWEGTQQRGEDLYFSEKCHQQKILIHVDTRVEVQHITSAAVGKHADSWQAHVKLLS